MRHAVSKFVQNYTIKSASGAPTQIHIIMYSLYLYAHMLCAYITRINSHTDIYVHVHVHRRIPMHLYIYCIHTYINTYIHSYIHTFIYTYIHT